MKTIHIKGWADKLNLCESLSDNNSLDWDFPFAKEGKDIIKNVFLRIYDSDKEISLEEVTEQHTKAILGDLEAIGQYYGYSEYTIEGFIINNLKLGGHDIGEIIKQKNKKYLHILIDVIPCE